jgi:hypothetical protein
MFEIVEEILLMFVGDGTAPVRQPECNPQPYGSVVVPD